MLLPYMHDMTRGVSMALQVLCLPLRAGAVWGKKKGTDLAELTRDCARARRVCDIKLIFFQFFAVSS